MSGREILSKLMMFAYLVLEFDANMFCPTGAIKIILFMV
jgi:hypothetical protein